MLYKSIIRRASLLVGSLFVSLVVLGQDAQDVDLLQKKINTLRTTELVMSMSQRSLIMPSHLGDLKALIAKQAFNFWSTGDREPYVSHLNVYSALHQANKFLDFDNTTLRAYNQVGAHTDRVTSIVFGPDPNHYFSSATDGTVLKWDLQNPKAVPEIVYQTENIIRSLDVSDDGKVLMAVFYQTGIALVSLENSSVNDVVAIQDPESTQTAVFMPNEQKYLMVSKGGEVKVKGIQSETKMVGKTESTVLSLHVDENDGTIYAGNVKGILESWEDKSYFGYEIGSSAINCLDISPDGKLLAIGRERGDVLLWSIEQKRLERLINGHQSAITDIEFSPDNQSLLTTSRDRTARLWDLSDSRKLPLLMDDHEDWVMTGCFDPSGQQIITGSRDEFVRIWPTDPKVLAERICGLVSRNLTKEEWEEFVGDDIPYQKTCSNLD